MLDICIALQKMLDVTADALLLISLVDHGFTDVYERVFGENEPECIYLYNSPFAQRITYDFVYYMINGCKRSN